jgi:hypothetical protein
MKTLLVGSVLLIAALIIQACHTGPVAASVGAGLAGALAVADQLLQSGAMTADQHGLLVGSLKAIDESVRVATSHSVTPEALIASLGGTAATVVGAVRMWRGPAAGKAEKVHRHQKAIQKELTGIPIA